MCERPPPAIPAFSREFFEGEETFTRIGEGEIGGKASGLLTVRDQILSRLSEDEARSFEVVVPTLTVITTEIFEIFMAQNDLYEIALSDAGRFAP